MQRSTKFLERTGIVSESTFLIKKRKAIDIVRDLTAFSRSQLRFKESKLSEPQLYCEFNEDYYYMVACVDSAQDYSMKPPKNIFACCANIRTKTFPFKDKPRYVCRGRCCNAGRQYMLDIADRYTVVIKVTDILQIYDFLRTLCGRCLYPKFNCCCIEFDSEFKCYWNIINSKTGKLQVEKDNSFVLSAYRIHPQDGVITEEFSQMLFFLENLLYYFRNVQRSKTPCDLIEHTLATVRAVTGQSVLTLAIENFLRLDEFIKLQGDEWYETLENLYLHYDKLKDTLIGKRYIRMLTHTVAHLIYYKLGLKFNSSLYNQFEQNCYPSAWEALTFVDAIVGVITISIKVGAQSIMTGSLLPFYVDGTSIGDWNTRLLLALAEYEAVNCPEVCGKTSSEIIEALDKCIEEGQLLVKTSINELARSNISKILSQAIVRRTKQKVLNATSRIRKSPLGIIVYGPPGIGKTDVMTVIRLSLSAALNYDPSQDFVYIREGNALHYDSFNESKAVVIIDDAAQMILNKAQPDQGIQDLIKMRNNIPFNMPMADLSDKGKVPFRPSLLLVSTNVKDLHIKDMFSSPFAVMRRFIHLTVELKEEYKNTNGLLKPDPELLKENPMYCPYWRFIISEPQKNHSNSQKERNENEATWVEKYKFETWEEFLKWLIPIAVEHNKEQTWFVKRNQMQNEMCMECKFPMAFCKCKLKYQDLFSSATYNKLVIAPILWKNYKPIKDFPLPTTFVEDEQSLVDLMFFMSAFMRDTMKCEIPESTRFEAISKFLDSAKDKGYDFIRVEFPKFLSWYEYHYTQDQEIGMSEIAMESMNNKHTPFTDRVMRFFIRFGISLWFQYRIVRVSLWYLKDLAVIKSFATSYVMPYIYEPSIRRQLFREAGEAFKTTWLFKNKWYVAMFGFSAIAGYFGTKKLIDTVFFKKEDDSARSKLQSLSDYLVKPEPKDESEIQNVWQYSNEGLTSSNFKPAGFSSLSQLDSAICTNMVLVNIICDGKNNTTRGLILGNDAILVNKHINQKGPMKLCLTFMSRKRNKIESTLTIEPSQFIDMPGRDVSIIMTKGIPAIVSNLRRSLYNALPEGEITGHLDGYYLIKQENGDILKHRVYNIEQSRFRTETGDIFKAWKSFSKSPTSDGECGALLFAETKRGPLLLGIHSAINMDSVKGGYHLFASPILNSDYEYGSGCSVGEIVDVQYQNKDVAFIDFHDSPNIVYHGELVTHNIRYKSSVVKTSIHDYILTLPGFGDFYTAPPMHKWKPQQLSLKEIVTPVTNFNEAILMKAAMNFYNYLIKTIPEEELALLQVYDYETAVNGVDGVNFVDAINKQTSMGFPYKKCKMHYIDIVDGKAVFKPEVKRDIEIALEKMEKGIRPHCIFSANLKDEPISHKKAEMNKVRVFYSCPLPLLIIVRMFLASFCRVVQRNRRLFKCAVGMNHFSLEWGQLYKCLTRFGDCNFIAGDYAFFDKRMHFVILRYAFQVIRLLCKKAGYTESEMTVLEVIEGEICNPCVDYFGSNFTFLSSEVSGHQMTTILNCFVNVLYLSYAYICCGYDIETFFDNVELVVLGDDHVVAVAEEHEMYNHTNIAKVFEFLGVGYTMADKESASVPYIDITDVTFLKRRFVEDDETGYVFAPLELKSLCRTLTYQIESKTVHKDYQLFQAMTSTLMDSFMYGRKFFNKWREILLCAPRSEELEVYIAQQPFKDYDYYLDLFLGRAAVMGRSQNITSGVSYCKSDEDLPLYDLRVEFQSLATRAFLEVPIQERDRLPPEERSADVNNELNQHPKNLILANYQSKTSPASKDFNKDIEDKVMSEADPIEENVAVDQETIKFVNEITNSPIDISTDLDMVASNEVVNTTLGKYLKRPAKIATYTWAENESGALKVSYKPWRLFFNIASIKNKILNYAYMRGKLHLKFTINASQFYYGSIAAIYTPGFGYSVWDRAGQSNTYDAGYQVLSSQKPHVWLDPQKTSTEEMVLPFTWCRDFIQMKNNSDLDNLGTIDLVQYATLRSANGVSTAGVTIIVYAWMDEIELTGNTSVATLQSKVTQGTIGKACSVASRISGELKDDPDIGSLAMSVQGFSKSLGKVADFFGFTNVPVTDDVKPYKPTAFHTLASSTISEPINKLSLQPMQEVTVSTKTDGIDEGDPLTIKSFVGRESFLTGSLWATTSAENAILFTSFVTPNLWVQRAVGAAVETYGTPMSHASQLFENWRGDIIFKIKVIKSKYHQGRLNIAWDPLVKDLSTMPNNGDPSVYNVVMDLELTDEVEIRVPYMQDRPFTKVEHNLATSHWSNGPVPTGLLASSNGCLQVRVINRLTAPEATSDVDILVFVRGADNLEYSVPYPLNKNVSVLKYQSKVTHVDLSENEDSSDRYKEMIGERIVSLRELLHRQSLVKHQIVPKNADFAGDIQWIHIPVKRLPNWYGYDSTGAESARNIGNTAYIPFNYCRTHPLNFMVSCFLGYKGSTNYTFNVLREFTDETGHTMQSGVSHASVSRMVIKSNNDYKTSTYALADTASTSLHMSLRNVNDNSNLTSLGDGQMGMALTNQLTQAGLSANLPYYCTSKWLYTYPVNYYSDVGATMIYDDQNNDWFKFTTSRRIKSGSADRNLEVSEYCGTGPDFNVFFFICVPVLYTYTPSPNTAEV